MKIAGCVIQNRNIIESNQHTFHAIYKGEEYLCVLDSQAWKTKIRSSYPV